MRSRGFLQRPWLAAAIVAVTVSVPVPLAAQRGALVQSRNLGELVSQSTTIVRGHILSAKVEPHPDLTSLSTVVVTMRVAETLKGDVGETFTFRQFIWDVRDRYDAAGYSKGQDLLILINPATRYGLTSPAGLDQGRFRIARDAMGREVAVNGRGNAGLFRGLPEQLKSKRLKVAPHLSSLVDQPLPGPIVLQDLRDLVRELNAPPIR
jgi:hypothetical protein